MEISDYKYRTELHAHTSPASACGHIPAKELVHKYKELGYDSLVITNHFADYSVSDKSQKTEFIKKYLTDFYDAKNEGDKIGINVILGAELRFSESANDYLFFGVKEDEFSDIFEYLWNGVENFSKNYKKENQLLIQAHPFRDGMIQDYISYMDGIEVFNMCPGANSRIALAAKLAKKSNGYIIGGSDCHEYGLEGLIAMLTKNEIKTGEELVDTIKSKDYLFEFETSIINPYGV